MTATAQLLAYHNDPSIKAKYVARVEAHRAADELIQGTGWESNGHVKGCAVGCTFDAYDHSRGPVEIGVPEVLMHLEDAIFEGLPPADAMLWPTRFLNAIPVGADLSRVHHKFFAWLLTDSGLLTIADVNREAIAAVAELHRRAAEGEDIQKSEWESAAESAWSAWSARSAAALSAAAWSARSAALSAAAWSAESAWSARSAAESAAARSAWSASWKAMAEKLIELLQAAPVMTAGSDAR